ncbi:hypothetical protein BKA60DRAFT_641983 [Fusarium oxysporum]|nr:hypothetical protein BKA60DRAFT_641983 [Fusarium oxysporum]
MPKTRSVFYYGPSPPSLLIVACRVSCLGQLLSSLAVLIPIVLLINVLRSHQYAAPWAFYFLAGVSVITLITLPVLCVISWRQRLKPLRSLLTNSLLTGFWVASFGVVVARLSHLIFRRCFGGARGTMCRLYVVIFVGSIVGLLSCLFAVVCDILATRRQLPEITYTKAQVSAPRDSELFFDDRGTDDFRPYDRYWPSRPSHMRSHSAGALAPSTTHSRSSSPALSHIETSIFTECEI